MPTREVEQLGELTAAVRSVANAVMPLDTLPAQVRGAAVASLTEAVMLAADGLCAIAESLNSIAEAMLAKTREEEGR